MNINDLHYKACVHGGSIAQTVTRNAEVAIVKLCRR